jgi:hypothetical protein
MAVAQGGNAKMWEWGRWEERFSVLPTTFAEASTSAKATVDKSAVRMWECCQLATGDVSVHLTLPTDVVSGQSA